MKLNKFKFSRRQFVIGLTGLSFAALAAGTKKKTSNQDLQRSTQQSNARLGINITSVNYYNTEFPFCDLMKQAGARTVTTAKWTAFPPKEMPSFEEDENGWPKAIPKGFAVRYILTDKSEAPRGKYVVLFDGEGHFTLNNMPLKITKDFGRCEFDIKQKGGIYLLIIDTNPSNPLRNIRVLMPNTESLFLKGEIWHPLFLKRWSGVACLRMMDLLRTNNSNIVTWADRPKMNNWTWGNEKGVPLEALVSLSNRLDSDPWFCIPHLADDDYVKNFAKYIDENLKPTLKCRIEYSNEVWNFQFNQAKYAMLEGQKLQLDKKDTNHMRWRFYSKRSTEIHKIFSSQLKNQSMLVKVFATQAYWIESAVHMLEWNKTYLNIDELAIAPYLLINLDLNSSENKATFSAEEVKTWGVDQLHEKMVNIALPNAISNIVINKSLADKYGLKLVAYEGGQHINMTPKVHGSNEVTNLMMTYNRSELMGDVYAKYYEAWASAGGDLHCAFASVGPYSKWGCWGLLESWNDFTPKYLATINWAKSRGQQMEILNQLDL